MTMMNDLRAKKSEAVQGFCTGLWDARERGELRAAADLARGLATATAADVAVQRGYDPEADQRVAWARTVIGELRRRPSRRPAADGNSEAIAAWLLDRMPTPTGKALALSDF